MVKEIENVSAELHVEPLIQLCVLGQREVKILEVRADESVAAQVAKVLRAGNAAASSRIPIAWRGKRGEVQQLVMAPSPCERIAYEVWTFKEFIAVVVVGKRIQVIGLTAGKAQQAINGPAVGEQFRLGGVRQVIAEHPGEAMARVKV